MAQATAAAVPESVASRSREGRWRAVLRTALPFLVVGAAWEAVARAGVFHPRLFPSLEAVAAQLVRLTASGVLPHHAADTLLRLIAGFALAAVVGVAVGIVMGRWRLAEDVLLPPVSMAAPIPGIAYAPLFLLWFGPGSVSTVLLVAFVSAFPVIFNTWTGWVSVREGVFGSAWAWAAAVDACSSRWCCRGHCRTSSPGCAWASRRRGVFLSGSRCSPRSRGASAG